MTQRTVIVLAAGQGKRMKSDLPKVLHPLLGRSLVGHVLAATAALDATRTVVVVGHQPTLGQAAALALTGRAAQWSLKKGALWWLEFRGDESVTRAVIAPDLV